MNRRKLLASLFPAVAALAIPEFALVSCAPKHLPWSDTAEVTLPFYRAHAQWFEKAGKKYWLWGWQKHEGETLETWVTPNGYVHLSIGGPLNYPELLYLKQDAIAWHDEHYLAA